MKQSKYHSTKVTYGGMTFDSRKEYRRYQTLQMLEKGGVITNLRRQVRYELIPNQYTTKNIQLKTMQKQKQVLVERKVEYVADFVYEQDGTTIVEDTKGFRTADYIIKRKLMLWVHGIKIEEI
jgi:glutamine synthetase type III